MEKLPPIEKVYEAWSAVADGRVELHPDERGLDADRVEASAREAYDALGALDIAVKRGRARQPMRPRFDVAAR